MGELTDENDSSASALHPTVRSVLNISGHDLEKKETNTEETKPEAKTVVTLHSEMQAANARMLEKTQEMNAPNGTQDQVDRTAGINPGISYFGPGSAIPPPSRLALERDSTGNRPLSTRPGAVAVHNSMSSSTSTPPPETAPPLVDQDTTTLLTAHLVDSEAFKLEADPELLEKLDQLENAPTAVVVGKQETPMTAKRWFVLAAALLVVVAVVVVVLAVVLTGKEPNGSAAAQEDGVAVPASSSKPEDTTVLLQPTLKSIRERGFIRCRVESFERRQGYGLSLDLCRALSAAIFGDANRTEYPLVPWREHWHSLNIGSLDVSTSQAAFNMGRDIYEQNTGTAQMYSTPWYFSGTQIAGDPAYVDCADRGDTLTGVCKDLVVCSLEASTNNDFIQTHLDGTSVHLVEYSDELFEALATGLCNAVAGDPPLIYEQRARDANYTGEYVFGKILHSKEPWGMASRGDDPEWADFHNAVLQAFMTAEKENITQENATLFPRTHLFGESYENMFVNALSAVGNWGELFSRNYGAFVPRTGPNLLNLEGHSAGGLLFSPPFSNLDFNPEFKEEERPGLLLNGTLQALGSRQRLRCGVIPNRPGFAGKTRDNQTWSGMDVDLCHGLSVALFEAPDLVDFVLLEDATAGFMALAEDIVDVFAGAPYSLEADVKESTTDQGYAFSPVYFYGQEGEMLTLATSQNATQFTDFVRWCIYCLIYAEEEGYGSKDAQQMPTVDLFGLTYELMFRLILLTLGNYGDLYERNLGALIPRGGANLLNDGTTPLIDPLPLSMFV